MNKTETEQLKDAIQRLVTFTRPNSPACKSGVFQPSIHTEEADKHALHFARQTSIWMDSWVIDHLVHIYNKAAKKHGMELLPSANGWELIKYFETQLNNQ